MSRDQIYLLILIIVVWVLLLFIELPKPAKWLIHTLGILFLVAWVINALGFGNYFPW